MPLSDSLFAAVIGFLSAIITSLIAAGVTYRKLKLELLGKHNQELINRQFVACESLWLALESASRSVGENRVVVFREQKIYIVLPAARHLYDALTGVFNSADGLYFSRHLRTELFDLRGFIETEFVAPIHSSMVEINVSRNKYEKFDGKVQNLRKAIREEIDVEDPGFVKKGLF